MSYINKLQNLGLSKEEAEVYLAFLKVGVAKISDITKIVEIPRTSIYVHAKSLVNKGFLKKTKKEGIEYFLPVEPSDILKEENEKVRDFAEIVPELENLSDFMKKESSVEYLDTKDGIKKLLRELAGYRGKEPIYFIEIPEAAKTYNEIVGSDFVEKFQKILFDKNIIARGVSPRSVIDLIKSVPGKAREIYLKRPVTTRVIDDDKFPFHVNLYLLYPDIVFISAPQDILVVKIKNKFIYESFIFLYKSVEALAKPIDLSGI